MDGKDDDGEDTEGEGWDGRRGRHDMKDNEVSSARPGSSGAPKHKSVINQYGSNLLGKGDIFPILKSIMTPAERSPPSQEESEDTDGEQPPLSLSLVTDSTTPYGIMMLGMDGRTPRKAMRMSEENRVEVGLSPSWESDLDKMRERERRSKSNMDRPSLVRNVEGKEIAMQLVFEDGEKQGSKEVLGSKPMDGEVIGELATQVARAPRKANPRREVRHASAGAGRAPHPNRSCKGRSHVPRRKLQVTIPTPLTILRFFNCLPMITC
jgi:hypothetical protein